MGNNSVTIERDGVVLTLIEAGRWDGQYTLEVVADTNDADYVYKESHYTREEFKKWHVLGNFIILSLMKDTHFYNFENLVEFFDGEYDMEEILGIPEGSGYDTIPHSVSTVRLTYFEAGLTYQVFPENYNKEDKRKIAEEFLEWQSEFNDLDESLIPNILCELGL